MGNEINLVNLYPQSKRDLTERANQRIEEDRQIARRVDEKFFDEDRRYGYDGFQYHLRFWQPVVPAFQKYCIAHAKEEVRDYVQVADARELPFEEHSFDFVISIKTFHNLKWEDCKKALQEMERVSRGGKFVTVDAYCNDGKMKRIDMWNLTALTYMHVDEWRQFFKEVGYTGGYYWFIP